MKRIFLLLIGILCFSCSETDTNSYNLSGTAEGFGDNTQIMVFELKNNQPVVVDTIYVKNGVFNASYPKTANAGLHYLRVGGFDDNLVYVPEDVDLKVTIYKDSMAASIINGGAQNEAYRAFNAGLKEFDRISKNNSQRYRIAQSNGETAVVTKIRNDNAALVGERTAYKRKFIQDNGNSIYAPMLLAEMLQRKEITAAEAGEYLKSFSPKLSNNHVVTTIKQSIAGMKGSEIGGMAPKFSAPTPEGEILALDDALGEYTLIDFWASWCKPCRRENPNVVKVYNKYHDKGFNIISVSLDRAGQKERWLKAIEDDKMDWHHVSNLKFWQDPVAQMYSVRSIPATFLLDKEGRIIAKNLRGQALEAKVASLLAP